MNEFSFRFLDLTNSKAHLTALETPLGTRSFGQSVSYCNRCGLCLQSCPFYVQTQQEPLSPRGKNQTARLLLQRKIHPSRSRKELEQIAFSCTLCGRCTRVCPGQIPTAQHVLELRRLLGNSQLPASLERLLKLRSKYPNLFYKIARAGLFLRRMGIVKLMRFSGLVNLLGMPWLHQADRMIPPSTPQERAEWKALTLKGEKDPSLIYIPSMETELFLPRIGISTWKIAAQEHRPLLWTNTPCGLFEFVYGNVRNARRQVEKLITRHSQLKNGTLPILTDSVDTYNFLKQAATLFEEYPHGKEKARHFAEKVLFVTDIFPKRGAACATALPVTLDTSALFSTEEKPVLSAGEIVRTLFGKNFVHCKDRQADLPAVGQSFIAQNKAALLRDLSLRPWLEKEVKTVIVLSGWALMEVYAARKDTGAVQVIHIAQLNG